MPRRAKAPPTPYNSTNITLWQATDALVTWARSSPQFSAAIAVLQNEQLTRGLALPNNRADAAIVQTGRMLGWSEAISTLLALRQYPEKTQPQPAVTYGVDEKKLAEMQEEEDYVSD